MTPGSTRNVIKAAATASRLTMSANKSAKVGVLETLAAVGVELSEEDMDEYLDLRDFMDPAPALASELMPLSKM